MNCRVRALCLAMVDYGWKHDPVFLPTQFAAIALWLGTRPIAWLCRWPDR